MGACITDIEVVQLWPCRCLSQYFAAADGLLMHEEWRDREPLHKDTTVNMISPEAFSVIQRSSAGKTSISI
jgi:hypothetical protein